MPKQKGGSKKVGRYKQKCEQYSRRQQKEKNALKHMLKSNCYKDVVEYAKKHGLKVPPPRKVNVSPHSMTRTEQMQDFYET